jgi:hypothetical protein
LKVDQEILIKYLAEVVKQPEDMIRQIWPYLTLEEIQLVEDDYEDSLKEQKKVPLILSWWNKKMFRKLGVKK